jgi:hypothetical protein
MMNLITHKIEGSFAIQKPKLRKSTSTNHQRPKVQSIHKGVGSQKTIETYSRAMTLNINSFIQKPYQTNMLKINVVKA